MINASVEFRQHIEKGKPLYSRADLKLADGTVLALEPTDFAFNGGFSIESATSSTNNFDIGGVIPKKLTMKLNNYDGRFNQYSFADAYVTNTEVFADLDSGTRESIKKGQFKVDRQEFKGSIVTLTCYDALNGLDTEYKGAYGKQPFATFLQYIADSLGIGLHNTLINIPSARDVDIPNAEYTNKQLFNWVLQCLGFYAYITVDNKLAVAWYDTKMLDVADDLVNAGTFRLPSTDIYDAGTFTDMSDTQNVIDGGTFADISNRIIIETIFNHTVAVDNVTITGVRVRDNNNRTYSYGTTDYMIEIDNPLMRSNTGYAYNLYFYRLNGMTFRPMNITTLNNPLIEAGDVGLVVINGVPYPTIFTNVTYSIGKYTKLICGAKTKEEAQAIINDKSTQSWSKGEDIKVGGVDNQLGKFEMFDTNGNKMGYWDNTGIHLNPEDYGFQAVTVQWGDDTTTSKGVRVVEISSNAVKVRHTYTPVSSEITESATLSEDGIYFSHPDGDVSLTRTQLIQLLTLIQ